VRVALTITARLRDFDLDLLLERVFVGVDDRVLVGADDRVLVDDDVCEIDRLGFREGLDVSEAVEVSEAVAVSEAVEV